MKLNLLKSFIVVAFFVLCQPSYAQTNDAVADTINKLDASNLKQGYWILKDKFKKTALEEGYYIDNKRRGLWTFYFTSGKVKCAITYVNNKPNGPAKLYYENGTLAEEGTWIETKWVGEYHMYYPSGTVAYDWNFDLSGKRVGVQRYFYENGKPMYEGEWKDGKNSGNLSIFDDKGTKMGERVYNENGYAETLMNSVAQKDSIIPSNKDYRDFNLTGNSTVVNFNGKVDKSGYFDKGKLMNGTAFEYDSQNNLIRKTLYRDGEIFKTIEIKP